MSRPKGTKNVMRTPEEKEEIVQLYLNQKMIESEICYHYNLALTTFRNWVIKYKEEGIKGLQSQTGKARGEGKGRPRKYIKEEIKK